MTRLSTAAAIAQMPLTGEEIHHLMQRRLAAGGNATAILEQTSETVSPVKVVEVDPSTEDFITQMKSLDGLRLKRKGNKPRGIVVNADGTKKGIFWAGQMGSHPYAIGLCKLNLDGTCNAGRKGVEFLTPQELYDAGNR